MKHAPTIVLLLLTLAGGCALTAKPGAETSEGIAGEAGEAGATGAGGEAGATGVAGEAGAPNTPPPCATEAQQIVALDAFKTAHDEVGKVGEWIPAPTAP